MVDKDGVSYWQPLDLNEFELDMKMKKKYSYVYCHKCGQPGTQVDQYYEIPGFKMFRMINFLCENEFCNYRHQEISEDAEISAQAKMITLQMNNKED